MANPITLDDIYGLFRASQAEADRRLAKGIAIDAGVDRYAYQQGLFVMKQTGETVAIVNDDTFRPSAW